MRSRYELWVAGIALLAASLLAGTGGNAAGAQVLQLRFGHFVDESHPGHLAAKQFAARVEERTKGQVKIAIYPNNTLGSPPEQAEQIKLGHGILLRKRGRPGRASATRTTCSRKRTCGQDRRALR